tara:strand:+ start:3185 stop:4327 length:1143 start_codon:yes stop_codon:yes gene_type:complete
MNTTIEAFTGAAIFDGTRLYSDSALLIAGGRVAGIVPEAAVPAAAKNHRLSGGTLLPGYVDLQVNGGGGLMFNDQTTPDALQTMADAHALIGATSILPTLITDRPERTIAAIDAVDAALRRGVTGIEGLHLEGPHLSLARKGAHDPALIRPMSRADMTLLQDAAQRLPVLKITVAPETVTAGQIGTLSRANVLVSLGHSDAPYDLCRRAAEAGARCVTHLFNAMSPLGNREPGVVGAALGLGSLSAGLIADNIHVHPESMALALRAKTGPGQIFLVSDAMATAGSEIGGFALNGRWIARRGDKLTLQDGTLAGAHLDLTTALRNVLALQGVSCEQAFSMATSRPANLIGQADRIGHLTKGALANFLHLADDLTLARVWHV